jgi:outer membrane protein assembly factor BamD (BamD/ComL family)
VNYKVANLLLKHFEDHTETALLMKCLKCLGDAYQSTGNEQEAKKFRRVLANVKKKLKPKKLPVNDGASVVESVIQPQDSQF